MTLDFIYIYIVKHIMSEMTTAEAFGVKRMSLSSWGIEVLRELRWWHSPACTSCPWGLVALGLLVACCIGICIGACTALLFVSQGCRSGLLVLLRFISTLLQPAVPQPLVSVGSRLAEYRRQQ